MINRQARLMVGLMVAVTQFVPLAAQQAIPMANNAAFEVASVKYVEHPDFTQPVPQNRDPGFVIYRRISLKLLLMKAFRVGFYQCDGPSWLDQAHYDITAKIPENASPREIPAMLQNVLVDRFSLQFHWDTRAEAGYALVVGKNGPKLKRADHTFSSSLTPSGHIQLADITMQGLAESLSADLGQPIVNMTNLDGEFDVVLDVDPATIPLFAERMRSLRSSSEPELGGPTLTAAVEKLGLKLESRKVQLEHLVVDRIQRIPTAN